MKSRFPVAAAFQRADETVERFVGLGDGVFRFSLALVELFDEPVIFGDHLHTLKNYFADSGDLAVVLGQAAFVFCQIAGHELIITEREIRVSNRGIGMLSTALACFECIARSLRPEHLDGWSTSGLREGFAAPPPTVRAPKSQFVDLFSSQLKSLFEQGRLICDMDGRL